MEKHSEEIKKALPGEVSIQVDMSHARTRDVVIGPESSLNYSISSQELAQLSGNLAQPSKVHADLLLVTATNTETAAVIKAFPSYQELFLAKNVYYDFGSINGARICLIQSAMGALSVRGSLQTVTRSINALSPAAIIMIGVAFGAKRSKQNIGDILVSQQILAYESQKISQTTSGDKQILPRGDRITASAWLLNRCHNGCVDWPGAEVHFGLLLSGDKLIDNRELKGQLLVLEPEAIGGEMEGAGLYAAAQYNKVDWIIVKAICDWADGNKDYRKEFYQQQAGTNAASFVLHVIQKGGFHQGWSGHFYNAVSYTSGIELNKANTLVDYIYSRRKSGCVCVLKPIAAISFRSRAGFSLIYSWLLPCSF